MVQSTDGTLWKGEVDTDPTNFKQYFLNAYDNEGLDVQSFVEFEPNGTPVGDLVTVQSDGNDRIFGDMGFQMSFQVIRRLIMGKANISIYPVYRIFNRCTF